MILMDTRFVLVPLLLLLLFVRFCCCFRGGGGGGGGGGSLSVFFFFFFFFSCPCNHLDGNRRDSLESERRVCASDLYQMAST